MHNTCSDGGMSNGGGREGVRIALVGGEKTKRREKKRKTTHTSDTKLREGKSNISLRK